MVPFKRYQFIMTIISLPCHSHHTLSIRSDEGLTLETSAFESLYGGQFTLSTQIILLYFPPTQHHSFVRNLPLYSFKIPFKVLDDFNTGHVPLSSAGASYGKLNICNGRVCRGQTTSLQSKQHERGLCRGERGHVRLDILSGTQVVLRGQIKLEPRPELSRLGV